MSNANQTNYDLEYIQDIVDHVDTITDIIVFLAMLILTVWCLCKYRKQLNDRFFVFSLCMYPVSYILLTTGAILYLDARSDEDEIYAFFSSNILPLNYLVIWTIELLICFEM